MAEWIFIKLSEVHRPSFTGLMALVCEVAVAGFILAALGFTLSCVATAMNAWKTMTTTVAVLSETTVVGLWYTCVDQGTQWECKAYDTFLGVPSTLLAARCLLVLSDLLSFLGASVTFIGLRCIRLPCEITSRTRGALTACAGVLCSLAAATTLVPVGAITYQTVQEFWDPNLPDYMPRYELGDAVFLGWGSGVSSYQDGP
uniref:claudin-22-like n=1 Tax=Myxine glutinosa TaxID=7769 RepID=UPI00358E7342